MAAVAELQSTKGPGHAKLPGATASMSSLSDSPPREDGPRGILRRLGPLAVPVALGLALVAIFSAFRLGFLLLYLGRLREVPGFLGLLPMGLRFDLMTVALALAMPVFALLLLPVRSSRLLRLGLSAYAAGLVALALFFELASFGFLDEYDSRPNRLFLEYLHKSDELTRTILTVYPVLVAITALLVGSAAWLAWRTTSRLVEAQPAWSWRRRLTALPVVCLVLFVAGRGGVSVRAANRSTANFTTNHLANELVPNALYAIGCAAYDLHMERSPFDLYGELPSDEILARVLRTSRIPPETCTNPEIPTLHRPPPALRRERPLNLVIVLEESLGAQFVETLGGRPVTPNLVKLSEEGLWFTRMYCTGTRTVRGIEGTVCGFPPNTSSSIVKLGLAQQGFFSMAGLLARAGYKTDYVYGGMAAFDNMETFLLSTGFQTSTTQEDFENPAFVATWGVSDEDLMRKANDLFRAHGDDPFFALVLSTSNHTPFEFPDGRIELYDAEKATRDNSVKYADYAIGELFRLARQEEYFENTLWVIVADHDTRAPSDDLLPVRHFHIPALILGPGVEPRHYTKIASQIDLMPTALHLIGLDLENPMPGRNVLAVPEDDPGRALLQYYNVNGFLSGDRVVIHQPYEPAQQFRVVDQRLQPMELDPELERDALAHVLLPWMLYAEQRYRLP